MLKNPPMLVFDTKNLEAKEAQPVDGLFYYYT